MNLDCRKFQLSGAIDNQFERLKSTLLHYLLLKSSTNVEEIYVAAMKDCLLFLCLPNGSLMTAKPISHYNASSYALVYLQVTLLYKYLYFIIRRQRYV